MIVVCCMLLVVYCLVGVACDVLLVVVVCGRLFVVDCWVLLDD